MWYVKLMLTGMHTSHWRMKCWTLLYTCCKIQGFVYVFGDCATFERGRVVEMEYRLLLTYRTLLFTRRGRGNVSLEHHLQAQETMCNVWTGVHARVTPVKISLFFHFTY